MTRADLTGSSSKDGDYSWTDGPILFLNGGDCDESVPRDQSCTPMLRWAAIHPEPTRKEPDHATAP
jgi:hypothetical protein